MYTASPVHQFRLLLRAPPHKTNTQSRSEAYPACYPSRHQPRHSLSQNPSQFGSVFHTKSTRSADPSLRIPLLPDSLTSHSRPPRPQRPRCPTRPQPALALGPIQLPPAAPYNDTRHGANRTHCLSRVRLSSWLLADPAIVICKPRLSDGPILAQPRFCINKVN